MIASSVELPKGDRKEYLTIADISWSCNGEFYCATKINFSLMSGGFLVPGEPAGIEWRSFVLSDT